ncbi:hypothetical protein [Mycobacterium sp. OAE908]|uniref:hypothetical protein n=1 Tax=Mycobacterium sp. OAE908 TaxID=2817899 RepID=UPI001AE6BAD7
MSRGFGDDGNITEVPWASVFDPAANVRALNAIQAQGFRAASKLVDRFVGAINDKGPGETSTGSAADLAEENGAGRRNNPDIERLMNIWWAMAGQFLVGSAKLSNLPFAGPATLEFGRTGGNGTLELHADAPGRASTEVWLHNNGPDQLGEIRLRCSDLLAHDGDMVPAATVHCDPNPVPMPRRSSRGVEIGVDVTGDVRPGVYRGNLLADGHPDVWLPVVLTVTSLLP